MASDLAPFQQLLNPPGLPMRDQDAAEAVPPASGTPRPITPAGPTADPGPPSPPGPRLTVTSQCRLHLSMSRSIWADWRRTARSWPPSTRPELPYPTSMPPPACRRPTTRPVIRSSPGQASALTANALARVRETLRLPRRGRGGRMESAETAQQRAALDLAIIRSTCRRRAQTLRSSRPHLGRRGALD